MAATFIPALVIKHNLDVYMNTDDLSVGVTMDIPTPGAGGVIDGDFWAVPITDGVVSGFNFIPTTPDSTAAPTIQSFHVFRLISRFGYDSWYVRGVSTSTTGGNIGYIQVAQDAECCADVQRTLPVTVPVLAACQTLCEWDSNDAYFGTLALPTLPTGWRYFPHGYMNEVALTASTAQGYGSKGALLTFLNSGTWDDLGVWSYADAGQNSLKLTLTAGDGTDVLCAEIIAINPSA